MVSLLKDNLSEENEMNLPLENGDWRRFRYKRRSVSAVRDFPPGCGPDAQRVDGNPHETVETERVKIEVDGGSVDGTRMVDEATGVFPPFQDNQLEVELGVPKTNSTQETTQTETGTVKTEMETLVAKLETSDLTLGVAKILPAVRHFPSGCGPHISENDVNPQGTTETEKETGPVTTGLLESSVAKLETSEMLMGVAGFLETDLQQLETSLPEIDSNFLSETNNEDMEMVMEMVRELSEVETPALERQEESCDREANPQVIEKESQEAKVAELKCKEPLTAEESQKEKVRSGVDSLVGQEFEAVQKIEGKLDVMVPSGSENSIPVDVNIPVRISSRNKITPRKVYATRDFPPFCGRNAPAPTVEDRLRINSGKKSLIAIKNNDTECGLLREAQNNVPGSNANKDGMVYDAGNMTVILPQMETHGKKMSEDRVDPTSHEEIPIVKSKETIVYQQDGSPNRKMSPDELDSQKMSEDGTDERADSGRVIVHALMANSCDPLSIKERPVCHLKQIIVNQKDRSPNCKMYCDETVCGSGLDRALTGSPNRKMSPDELDSRKMSEDGTDERADSGRVIVHALIANSCDPSSIKERPICHSKQIIVHQKDRSPNRNMYCDETDCRSGLDRALTGSPNRKNFPDELDSRKMSEDGTDERADSGRVIVHALMANSCDPLSITERPVCHSKQIIVHQKDRSPNCKMYCDETDCGSGLDRAPSGPFMTGEWTSKNPVSLSRSKAKKRNFSEKEKSRSTSLMKKSKNILSSRKAKESVDGDSVADHAEQIDDSSESRVPGEFEASLPPFGPNTSNHDARNRVRETLRLFQANCRKILRDEEARSRGGEKSKSKDKIKRIDLAAAKIVKEKGKEVNTDKQILGAVPGVEVGDEFQYRVELAIVGIHRLYQAGIDYMKFEGDEIVAASIVASGGYADELDNSDVLIYSGQGGLSGKDKQPEDQKLERGNLALKNSITFKNYVRVIRGSKETKASESADARGKIVMTYVYDGLYTVERFWQEEGAHGKLVFKFELRRVPGQPELAWKEVKKSNKSRTREGLCVNDISGGKEIMPICAVNTRDDEKPPPFTYVTRMIYPDSCNLSLPEGCDCKGGCLDAKRCLCAAKNGDIPYNFNGAIVEAKPLVYECGPSCKCPPSCYNRVSQHGIRFQLEIFKTESRGWGVRSLNSITAGSFICEYTGELLEDREAEKRTGNDEYLFDIGQNYNDCSHKPDAESNSNNVTEDGGFTIDAAHCGNVGRFINHSCSPNIYAQNVLYDHENKRMPHIMFFAAENIPPLKELNYHYNYKVDQVLDLNGEIKMKMCYCGSSECTGRMY